MSYPVFYVPAGDVLPIFFDTYAGATGASVTMTGLAVTDIEIYKDGGVTQRASDAGYTLLDTDGIDFDALTGIHGFSVDTGDNTDAGFYTVGAWFTVVVSAITVDSQTISFIAAQFRIMEAETTAGRPLTQTAALSANAITATAINADAITAAKVAADVSAEIADAVWNEDATGHQTQGTFGQAIGDPVADTNTIFKAVVTDATGATVGVDGAAILADTNELQTDWVNGGRLDLLIDAIKAKTDALPADPADASDVAAAIAALNDLSAAQAKAEVVAALATDTYAEPTGTPGATLALSAKISWLFMALRNGLTVTASKKTFLDDGGLGEWSKALSDDGTTYTEGEAGVP